MWLCNKFIIGALFSLQSVALFAKEDPQFPVSAIPRPLLENANVVYRSLEEHVEVVSPSLMTRKVLKAITILKEGGVDASKLVVEYNKFIKVNSIKASLYDAQGNSVRRIRADEILDMSAYDGFSLFTDSRKKIVQPNYFNYPFTVVYEYEETIQTLMYLSDFRVFQGYMSSVEYAVKTVDFLQDIPLLYSEVNGMSPVVRSVNSKSVQYKWEYRDFVARKPEPLALHPDNLFPMAKLSPKVFAIDGKEGERGNWSQFGLLFSQLNSNKQTLPAETLAKVQALVRDCNSDLEKVKRIYAYSQKKNRYVNVAMGLGGIEPYDAATVDRLSYGDCKALSNYVASLLDAVGIKGYYTLIGGGDNQPMNDSSFVSDYFNHVIVAVPLQKDTIWLECTNPYAKVNYLGSFTDDRLALMITDDGGRLCRTPAYKKNDNWSSSKLIVDLNSDGSAVLHNCSFFAGVQFESQFGYTLLDETDRRKALLKSLAHSDLKLEDYRFDVSTSTVPVIQKNATYQANHVGTFINDMMMVALNPLYEQLSLPIARKRESPLYIARNYASSDTIQINCPDGFEFVPTALDESFSHDAGSYSMQCVFDGDYLMVVTSFELRKGVYAPERYSDFREFISNVARKEATKVALKRN